MVVTISGFDHYLELIREIKTKLSKNKVHGNHVIRILEYLALHPKVSSWDAGKKCLKNQKINSADTMARRIFEGRTDGKKPTSGLVELGLVESEIKGEFNVYELSLFGLMFLFYSCSFTPKKMLDIAKANEERIPMIFNFWQYFKKEGISLKPLQIIAKGNLLINDPSMITGLPTYEMLQYLAIYKEQLKQNKFEDFVALWFYIYLMWDTSEDKINVSRKWNKMMQKNYDLRRWFKQFMKPMSEFYLQRMNGIKSINDTFTDLIIPHPNRNMDYYSDSKKIKKVV